MRIPLLVAALLVALVPLPAADAQGDVRGVRVIEDPSGDVILRNPSGTPVPGSTDRNRFLDLRAVDVEEQPDGYFVTVWVGGFPPEPGVAFFEEGFYEVTFLHEDVGFLVGMSLVQGASAMLASDPAGSGEYDHMADLEITVDAAAASLTAFVPRDLLADRDGAPPFPGRALTQFAAVAQGPGIASDIGIMGQRVDMGVYGFDDAAAPAGVGLPVQFGAAQSGDARLLAGRPFRASNGEAATFIFEVEASNLGDSERLYRLEAVGVPAGWQVTFPQPQVRLGAMDSQDLAVLASVPFAHQHGRIASFTVEMRDLADPASVGRAELGLHYTDPPQPAGHHPDLYLHSAAPGEVETALGLTLGGFGPGATMNTRVDDPNDDGVDVTGEFDTIDIGRIGFRWMVPLSPHLQMGLDTDLTRTGTISIPIGTTLPMPQARLEGGVYTMATLDEFGSDIEGSLVALIEPTPEVDILPTAPHTFEAALLPQKEGDFVRYDPELNLVLILQVSFARPSTITGIESPALKPGGHLTLPLLEYADPVDELFATAGGLDLELVEGIDRRAPPGGAAVATLRAYGAPGHYRVNALGLEAGWVQLPDALHVGEDGVGEARVAVAVPDGTPAGTVIDLVLEVLGEAGGDGEGGDGEVRSLARLRLTVDPEAPDEGGLATAGAGKDAPGLGLPALALVLAALVALAGRRQGL